MGKLIYLLIFSFSFSLSAQTTNWDEDYTLPGGDSKKTPYNRENIFNLNQTEFENFVLKGRSHALYYPVTISDLLIPYKALNNFFENPNNRPILRGIRNIAKEISHFESTKDIYKWLGLEPYPKKTQPQNPNPWMPQDYSEELYMGATVINQNGTLGMTFGCAGCHSSNLFGVQVLGLSNRFPRANEFFRLGKEYAPLVNPLLFKYVTEASTEEVKMLKRAIKATHYVGVKAPAVLGLDTSLAQVALSLSRRGLDAYATRFAETAKHPRKNHLETHVADSKPAVWWNVKYKTRWLSDGSIVSGNPVFTNFLWNELGRGTDLLKLEEWMNENKNTIEELTASVFASKAPNYFDFFDEESFDLEMAKRGETHFVKNCQGCHGQYIKNWDDPILSNTTIRTQSLTKEVWYHKNTPTIDVGTDSGRYLGMQYFAEDLNRLKISKMMGTKVVPQKGYVPPPLVGIWARWPYFHNNSAPNLCAVLSKATDRPKTYFAGPAINKKTDYDSDCGGYPINEKTPTQWTKNSDYFYDSTKQGLSNLGHEKGILSKDGLELMTPIEKRELIEFLKTL
jgi:hypothetical protein